MCTIMAAGMGVGLAGSLMRGAAEQSQHEAAAQVDRVTAMQAQGAAADAVERGRTRELQETMAGARVLSGALVAGSGSGAVVGTGAGAASRRASEAVLEVSRKTIRINAALDAYGLREQARAHYQKAQDEIAAGKNAFVGTFLSGIATAAGQAGRVAADMPGRGEESSADTPDQQYRDDTLRLEH